VAAVEPLATRPRVGLVKIWPLDRDKDRVELVE